MRAHILRQTRLGSQFRTKMFTCSCSLSFFFDILVRSSSYQAYLSCFLSDSMNDWDFSPILSFMRALWHCVTESDKAVFSLFLDKHDLVLLEEKSAILRSMLIVNTSALTQPMFSRNMEVSLFVSVFTSSHRGTLVNTAGNCKNSTRGGGRGGYKWHTSGQCSQNAVLYLVCLQENKAVQY